MNQSPRNGDCSMSSCKRKGSGNHLAGDHSGLLSQLRALGVEVNNHTDQMIYSKRTVKVEASGIVET
jgi:hypothetical protein